MKKFINDTADYAFEALDGMCRAHPRFYRLSPDSPHVVTRPVAATPGKVGVVTGGGSGHLPVFAGYVGDGLLNACAVGDVFASPSADEMAIAIRAADSGAGVLRLYGNYGGDIMNFDMAGDLAEMDGIATSSVKVADDIASAAIGERHKRRGVAGMIYTFKIAGAAAASGLDLERVTTLTQQAADLVRTIGVALSPCTVPMAGRPTFQLGDSEMEIGMGIHGEAGVRRGPLLRANQVADEMLDRLLADMPLAAGDEISLLLNSLGATPLEELYILHRRIADRLAALKVVVVEPLIGRYATSMEMAGVSLSLFKLDDALRPLLLAPAECAFWRVAQ